MTADSDVADRAGEPLQIVVMGVSGSGKTTVAERLAERLDAPFAEGDEFHSRANTAKMSGGHALNDADRAPWLVAIAAWLDEHAAAGQTAVVTCSALKRRYRDVLRGAGPGVVFVHLAGPQALVAERMGRRRGHFMPLDLLDSQYADLEALAPDERGVTLDVALSADELARQAVVALRAA